MSAEGILFSFSFERDDRTYGSRAANCDTALGCRQLDAGRRHQRFGQRQRVRRRLSNVITAAGQVGGLAVFSLEVADRFEDGLEVAAGHGRPESVGRGRRGVPGHQR